MKDDNDKIKSLNGSKVQVSRENPNGEKDKSIIKPKLAPSGDSLAQSVSDGFRKKGQDLDSDIHSEEIQVMQIAQRAKQKHGNTKGNQAKALAAKNGLESVTLSVLESQENESSKSLSTVGENGNGKSHLKEASMMQAIDSATTAEQMSGVSIFVRMHQRLMKAQERGYLGDEM